MLDLLTLQKTRNWLKKRQEDLLSPTRPYIEYDQVKIHQLGELIQELEEKINAIQVEQSIRPAENGVMLIKNTKAEKRYYCQTCHVEHSVYRIYFSTMHLRILQKVFKYCVDNKTHIIHKNDIPGLTHTDYGNFYALRRFGLLYWLEEDGKKIKGGHWGVAVTRIYRFLKGQYAIAEYSERNTTTEALHTSERKITVNEIPRYTTFAQDTSSYLPSFVKYEENPDIFTSDNP